MTEQAKKMEVEAEGIVWPAEPTSKPRKVQSKPPSFLQKLKTLPPLLGVMFMGGLTIMFRVINPLLTAYFGFAAVCFASFGICQHMEWDRYIKANKRLKIILLLAFLAIIVAIPRLVHPPENQVPASQTLTLPPSEIPKTERPIEDQVILYLYNLAQWGRTDIAQFPLDEGHGLKAKFETNRVYPLSLGIANKIPRTTLVGVYLHLKVPMNVTFKATHLWRWNEKLYPALNLKTYSYRMLHQIPSGFGKELQGDVGFIFPRAGDFEILYSITGSRKDEGGLNPIDRKFKIRLLE